MSPIALPLQELKPALIGLGKVISKRCALPVLNHIKIERTKDGWIALTGTDLDTFVTVRLEQPRDGQPLSLLVPYEEIQKLVKSCPKNDTLLLTGDSTAVTIQYAIGNQVAETKVGLLPVEEFPEIPRIKGEPVPLNDALRQSIHDAIECASIDETRLILNGAYIDATKPDAHYVVGTDGRHLFSSNSFSLPLKDSVLIPSHRFLGFKEFNNDGEWQIRVNPKEKDTPQQMQISSRRWRFICREIEGNYPNWRQVIPAPDQYATHLEIDPASVAHITPLIDRMPCDNSGNFPVGLELVGKKVSLISKASHTDNWTKVEIKDVKATGKDVTIFLNRHLLKKALQFGLNTVETIDALSPLRLSHEGRQMIIMPVRPSAPITTAASPTEEATKPQPAAPSPAAQEERTPMVNDTTTAPSTTTEPVTIEAQFDQLIEEVEAMKTTMQDHLTGLKALGSKLKAIQREHKAGNKELHSIRQTLKGLQGVKL